MPTTIAGHAFEAGEMTGGMLSLRVPLGSGGLVGLARALARLEGVRVTSGPAIASRGDCYLVHCPGFKMVLSSASHSTGFAQALLSRTIGPTLAITCELGAVFARLMAAPAPGAETGAADAPKSKVGPTNRAGWARTSMLRRAALAPGKTLLRKTPLARKTPLGRGRWRP